MSVILQRAIPCFRLTAFFSTLAFRPRAPAKYLPLVTDPYRTAKGLDMVAALNVAIEHQGAGAGSAICPPPRGHILRWPRPLATQSQTVPQPAEVSGNFCIARERAVEQHIKLARELWRCSLESCAVHRHSFQVVCSPILTTPFLLPLRVPSFLASDTYGVARTRNVLAAPRLSGLGLGLGVLRPLPQLRILLHLQ